MNRKMNNTKIIEDNLIDNRGLINSRCNRFEKECSVIKQQIKRGE